MRTVVMPTCKRPEMLALALEALDRTNEDNLDVRIFLDTDGNVEETEYVRDEFYPDAMIFRAPEHIQVPSGMWNILHSLMAGYCTGADYIFLVEEDVIVRPDFFKWHAMAQADGEWLATCGRKSARYPDYFMYQNPGSCFSREKLGLVVEHIKNEMFSNRKEYMDRVFGVMDESSDLDDGLIRRVARYYGLPVRYPETPKCSHIGFRWYNNLDIYQNRGDIKIRIAGLREMLPKIDPNGRYSKDFEPLI